MRCAGMLFSSDKGIPQKAFVEEESFLWNLGTIWNLDSDLFVCFSSLWTARELHQKVLKVRVRDCPVLEGTVLFSSLVAIINTLSPEDDHPVGHSSSWPSATRWLFKKEAKGELDYYGTKAKRKVSDEGKKENKGQILLYKLFLT